MLAESNNAPQRCRELFALVVSAAILSVLAPAPPAAADSSPLSLTATITHPVSGVYVTTGTSEAFSTPAIADITGDGRPELVIASLDGVLEAYSLPDRSRRWSISVGKSAIESSPVIIDVTGDGRADVVVGTMDGRVLIVDGPTGSIVRTFKQLEPLHCPVGTDCRPDGFFASPSVTDINGDGVLDIIAPSWDHTVYAWSTTGALLWRRYLEDTLWSSPVVADIDRNGTPEIILGGDIWAGNPLNAPEGGLVWILNRDGSTYPGYPKFVPTQTVWSSPAVADINRDGDLDVVVGTGTHFPDPGGRWVDAFTARTGVSLPGWPVRVDGRVMTSPAVGDLDGDPGLEVAVGSEGGYLYAFEPSGRLIWKSCASGAASGCTPRYSTHGGVAIADVDDDGSQEVVSAFDKDLRIYDGRSGAIEAAQVLSSGMALTPASTPAIAEVDGRTMIAQASFFQAATRVDLFTTGRRLCRADWPTFHKNPMRTGLSLGVAGASTPFKCPVDFVVQQYKDFLSRPLDPSGTNYWTKALDSGWSGSRVIRSFMGSPEFGRVVAPVLRANLAVFDTYPSSAEAVRTAAEAVRKGRTATQLADTLVNAPGPRGLTDIQFVDRVFTNVHGRHPTATELTQGVHRLDTGTTRGALVASYAESTSGVAHLEAPVNVAMSYLGMLNRVPDASGWLYWVPATRRGNLDHLVTGFQVSPEYRRRVGATAAGTK
ncbi:MAG: FG-GAP-like repeat-containing protein [Aquihabitans sp.]